MFFPRWFHNFHSIFFRLITLKICKTYDSIKRTFFFKYIINFGLKLLDYVPWILLFIREKIRIFAENHKNTIKLSFLHRATVDQNSKFEKMKQYNSKSSYPSPKKKSKNTEKTLIWNIKVLRFPSFRINVCLMHGDGSLILPKISLPSTYAFTSDAAFSDNSLCFQT